VIAVLFAVAVQRRIASALRGAIMAEPRKLALDIVHLEDPLGILTEPINSIDVASVPRIVSLRREKPDPALADESQVRTGRESVGSMSLRLANMPRKAFDFATLFARTSFDRDHSHSNAADVFEDSSSPRAARDFSDLFGITEESLGQAPLELFGSDANSPSRYDEITPLSMKEINKLSEALLQLFIRTQEYTKIVDSMDEFIYEQKSAATVRRQMSKQVDAKIMTDLGKAIREYLSGLIDIIRNLEPYRMPLKQFANDIIRINESKERLLRASVAGRSTVVVSSSPSIADHHPASAEAADTVRRSNSGLPTGITVKVNEHGKSDVRVDSKRLSNPVGTHLSDAMMQERLKHLAAVPGSARSSTRLLSTRAGRTPTFGGFGSSPSAACDDSGIAFEMKPLSRSDSVGFDDDEHASGTYANTPSDRVRLSKDLMRTEAEMLDRSAHDYHRDSPSAGADDIIKASAHSLSAVSGASLSKLRSRGNSAYGTNLGIDVNGPAIGRSPELKPAAEPKPIEKESAAVASHGKVISGVLLSNSSGTGPSGKQVQAEEIASGSRSHSRPASVAGSLVIPSEAIEHVRNHLERYIMSELYPITFGVAISDVEEDQIVETKLRSISWLSATQLNVPPGATGALIVRAAAQELRQMNTKLCPEDKLECIMSAAGMLYRSLTQHARRTSGVNAVAAADEFLPSMIFLTLRANVPKLMSNINYIDRFRDEQQLFGKAGYCFATVRSCIYYLRSLQADMVGIPDDEFSNACERALKGARGKLNGQPADDLVHNDTNAASLNDSATDVMLP
jgi:hypothetical protein